MKTYIIKFIREDHCSVRVLAHDDEEAASMVLDGELDDSLVETTKSDVNITDAWEEFYDGE